MALARTIRVQATSSVSHGTGSFVTGSFTPSDNSLLVVAVFYIAESDGASEGSIITLSGGGLTWTSRAVSTTSAGWQYGSRIFSAPVTTGASMALTAGSGGLNVHRYRVVCVEYTGYDTSTPIGATAVGASATGDGAASITLSGAPASTSEVFAAALTAFNGASAFGIDPGADFTEQDDVGETSWAAFQTQYRTGSTSTTVAWADLSSGSFGSEAGSVLLAVEVKEGSGGGSTNAPRAAYYRMLRTG